MTLLVLFNQPAGGATNYSITADVGSYVVSGVAAAIARNKSLSAAAGSYSVSGVAATITYVPIGTNYTVTADTGSYVVIGVAATAAKSKSLTADTGAYTYTGVAATVARNKALTASAGAYTYSGKAATITYAAAGGAVWPSPADVRYGVIYGPTGADYTGTYIGGMTLEITTGLMIKPLTSKLSTLL